jgi:hypothetical protein
MTNQSMTRRMMLGGISVLALSPLSGTTIAAGLPTIAAYRNPGCGCCEKWADLLKAAGFDVDMQDDANLSARRAGAGVPNDLAGCHTAIMGDYVIEGHVPIEDIKRLLATKPAVRGIAVAGMPLGSPGMEMGETQDAFDVFAFNTNGARTLFARHPAAK